MVVVENWEYIPTFTELVGKLLEYLLISYQNTFDHSVKLNTWNITIYDITKIAVMTAVLSTLRNILDKYVSLPIASFLDIPERNRQKIPESVWRLIFFLCAWIYEWYLVMLSDKYKFFEKPENVWIGWSLEAYPNEDIYFVYVVHSAFYLHWTYATLFLDTWRKDSAVLTFHHIMALCLLFLSHITRCHNLGVLLLFLNDFPNIFRDLFKLCIYCKTQGRYVSKWIEMMGNISFSIFLLLWFVIRFYWYPIKVMYFGAIHVQRLELKIPYIFHLNLGLWTLIVLNIYWGMWILKTAFDILSGQKLKDATDND